MWRECRPSSFRDTKHTQLSLTATDENELPHHNELIQSSTLSDERTRRLTPAGLCAFCNGCAMIGCLCTGTVEKEAHLQSFPRLSSWLSSDYRSKSRPSRTSSNFRLRLSASLHILTWFAIEYPWMTDSEHLIGQECPFGFNRGPPTPPVVPVKYSSAFARSLFITPI